MNPLPVSSSSDMPPESSGNCSYAFNMNNCDTQSSWIIDSGALDHMTYDPTDLACDIVPLRRNITNSNGVTSPVIGASTVHTYPLFAAYTTCTITKAYIDVSWPSY